MVLDYTSGPLSRYGLKFRNHVGAPGEGAADAFHLSNAVIIPEGSRRVVVGGKIGLRSDDTAPKDLAEEIDQAFKNVELALRACGLDKLERSPWEYVYKVQTFQIPGEAVSDVLFSTAKTYFKDTRPAWTAVVINALLHPDVHVEIEVEAYLPGGSKL